MRLIPRLAAALCLAAPAAAQDADSIAYGAIRQVHVNHGDVRDYTMVLVHGPLRIPAYVYREDNRWQVATPPEPRIAEMFSAAVMWPEMADVMAMDIGGEDDGGTGVDGRYLGTDTSGGRRAHVLFASFRNTDSMPDSLRMYVDVETRQLLRVAMAGPVDQEDGFPRPGTMQMTVDLAEYTARDGLTFPTRLRLWMQVDLGLSADEIQALRETLAQARAQVSELQGPQGDEARVTLDLFGSLAVRGEMEVEIRVEDVRVNPGPPDWFENSPLP